MACNGSHPFRKIDRPSSDGNALFGRLPPEVRFMIWTELVSKDGMVFSSSEGAWRWPETLISLAVTCRLFRQDQEAYPALYKFSPFIFDNQKDFFLYIDAFTPERRAALHILFISRPEISYRCSHHDLMQLEELAPALLQCKSLTTLQLGNCSSRLEPGAVAEQLGPFLYALGKGLCALKTVHMDGDSIVLQPGSRSRQYIWSWKVDGEKVFFWAKAGCGTPPIDNLETINTSLNKTWKEARRAAPEGKALDIELGPLVSARTRSKRREFPALGLYQPMTEVGIYFMCVKADGTLQFRVTRDPGMRSFFMERKRLGRGLSFSKSPADLLDPALPDWQTQAVVNNIHEYLEILLKGSWGATINPRMLIDSIKDLSWEDRAVERRTLKKFESLGTKWDGLQKPPISLNIWGEGGITS